MLLYSFISKILSMALLVGLAVGGCERFCGVSIRYVLVAVDPSVMLNVAAGEGFSIVSVGSIEEKEFLNEKLDKEKGDGAWSNSWIFNISLFTL